MVRRVNSRVSAYEQKSRPLLHSWMGALLWLGGACQSGGPTTPVDPDAIGLDDSGPSVRPSGPDASPTGSVVLTLDDYGDWSLDLSTGEWTKADDDTLPQDGWSLLSASSEETEGEDGRAARAFDDSPSTFWHSRYSGTRAEYPHELSIDLGAAYELVGLRVLPRQDGNQNGLIAGYEF